MAGIYVHIPFCQSKCIYCDFYSVAARKHRAGYVDAMLREFALRRAELGGQSVNTIYIGGGTPSVLPVEELARLLRALIADSRPEEVTVEVNPDDVTPAYAAALRRAGADRVSMGVQSFDDAMLRLLRRRHSAENAKRAYHCLRDAGFARLSLDLIFALPGQTLSGLRADLEQLLTLRPEHISCYGLMWEEGTLLHRMLQEGTLHEADDELYIAMYSLVCDALAAAGYEHYEVSNFALPGHRALHNSNYWNGTPYLGLGAGAHSYDGITRRRNPADLERYMAAISAGATAFEAESESDDERYDGYVMTRLRTADGIDLEHLAACFGTARRAEFERKAAAFIAAGTMTCHGVRRRITEQGWLTSDAIITDLMA